MAYFIDLFSPETYTAFGDSDRTVSGFRERQKRIASSVKPGDKLICYMTKLSRWVGILEVASSFFIDDTPIFLTPVDPFVVRFTVNPQVWLSPEYGISINEDICWDHLSFTKELPKYSLAWTGMVRGSLRRLKDEDGVYLETLLTAQSDVPQRYDLSDTDKKKMKRSLVKTKDSQVSVSVPDNEDNEADAGDATLATQRESIQMQALLAKIGECMNFKIWLPRSDRMRVLDIWQPTTNCLLEQLPLNYDDVTLNTIENIDVLWVKGRSVIRAFEVEHTTSIYSGILRMADLMALQPNLNIKVHIVAPIERRSKVFQEITRPVFAFLENGPLSESCTFLSYNDIQELAIEKRLAYMNDRVLDDIAEYAEDADI